MGASKPKGINRIVKLGYGYLYMREENFRFNENCIIYMKIFKLQKPFRDEALEHFNSPRDKCRKIKHFIFSRRNSRYVINQSRDHKDLNNHNVHSNNNKTRKFMYILIKLNFNWNEAVISIGRYVCVRARVCVFK